jgi:Winged helix-turn helix
MSTQAGANGFVGELWTLDRIGLVIERLTRVRHHPAWVWALLHYQLGWTVQRPKRRAAERDQATIDRWVKKRWPAIKQTVSVGRRSESGTISRTSPRGQGTLEVCRSQAKGQGAVGVTARP